MQKSSGRQIAQLVPAFFGIGGVAFIVAAGLLASLTVTKISGVVNVEGTVVAIIRESSTDGETFVPLIEYHVKGPGISNSWQRHQSASFCRIAIALARPSGPRW